MSDMTESATAHRIDQQCARYQHLHSGVIYRFVHECQGEVLIECIGRGVKRVNRTDLDNAEIWRRMP